MTDTNGNGRRLEALVESNYAKLLARYVMPLLVTILGFGAVQVWTEQRAVNREVVEIARTVAVHETRLDGHDRRLGWLERRGVRADPRNEARR